MLPNIRKITMADPYFNDADRVRIHHEIDNILSGALSMGPNVAAFEAEFSVAAGTKYAVAMNSCTSALEAALLGLGVEQGDEVIVPCETFIATGMAVHLVGGVPIFAEVCAETLCLDIASVRSKLTPQTKGVIIVYMAGHIPSNISEFQQFCADYGLFLIEDAAHAPGASLNGKKAGSFGHAGCFSFFPSKVMTSGEGGMLTTNDDALYSFARSYQHRGRDMFAASELYVMPGRNVRMTEMTALIGRVQLSHLQEFLSERRRVALIYKSALSNDSRITLILPDETEASAYWKVPLLLNPKYQRKVIADKLCQVGISVDWAYEPALHLQPVFCALYGTASGQLPFSEKFLKCHLCLPCHPRMSNEDTQYVADHLIRVLNELDIEQ